MHGTGFVFAATMLNRGGTVVTLPEQKFDATRLLDAIVAHGVTDLCIVGDAFCRPIVDVLDAAPGRYDLSKLKVVSSSGMMWSKEVKARLLAHAPQVMMIDFLNSSEASGMGRSITSRRSAASGREVRARQECVRHRRRRQADRARQRQRSDASRCAASCRWATTRIRRRRRPRSP